jgi:hypothetical protein
VAEPERCECIDRRCAAHPGQHCGNLATCELQQESTGERAKSCEACAAIAVEEGNNGAEFDAWTVVTA